MTLTREQIQEMYANKTDEELIALKKECDARWKIGEDSFELHSETNCLSDELARRGIAPPHVGDMAWKLIDACVTVGNMRDGAAEDVRAILREIVADAIEHGKRLEAKKAVMEW